MNVGNTDRRAEPEERLRFETLIAELSSKFVGLPAGEVDRGIIDAERAICDALDLDLLTFWQLTDDLRNHFTLTHLYSPQEGSQIPGLLNEEDFPWIKRQVQAGRIVSFSSLEELPAEAAHDRESFRNLGLESNLSLPLSVGGGPMIGVFCLNARRTTRDWPGELVKRLQLVAQIFANALARKRVEQALRDLADRYKTITTTTTDGFWEIDRAGKIVDANDEGGRLYGYSRDELLTKSLSDVEANENPAEIRAHIEQVMAAGYARFETRHRCKNGHIIDVEISTTYRPSSDTFLAFLRNITERKRAEEALRTSEARLEASADLAGVGYYEVDFGESCSFADERFGDICGVPAGQQQGIQRVEFWIEHIHPDDRQHVLEERRKAYEGEIERYDVEYRYLQPAHGQKWIHQLGCVATRNAAGHVIRAYGVIRDMTETKRAEMEARELRDDLAYLARVSTLGALSGSLAHELNQPLGIILSNAQAAQELLAQEPPDVAEVQTILADIVKADRRAGDVIVRLRAMFKHGQVSLQPLRLNQVITEVLHLARVDLIGRGVTVVSELAPGLPPIAGDRVHLQQLVLNLIFNAAEAMAVMSPETRRIHLQTMLHQNRVRASVRDEGCGLPADAERLFETFYTSKPQGLGMGLAICRSIVDAHHGRLWAEPHPERGAIFHFELPVAGSPDVP